MDSARQDTVLETFPALLSRSCYYGGIPSPKKLSAVECTAALPFFKIQMFDNEKQASKWMWITIPKQDFPLTFPQV